MVDLDAERAIDSYAFQAARFRLTAFALIEDEQPVEAEGALAYARICERAAEAEDIDPEPPIGPDCICFACRWQRLQAGLA
jgi:hypothetical protein